MRHNCAGCQHVCHTLETGAEAARATLRSRELSNMRASQLCRWAPRPRGTHGCVLARVWRSAMRCHPYLQPRVELERLGQRGGTCVPDAVLAQVQRGQVRVAWGAGEGGAGERACMRCVG